MSKQQKNDLSISEEQVVDFLKENPDFFEQHLDILAGLNLPHPTSGEAVSLLERQVGLLRDQNKGLECKLINLVQIARDNERLSIRLHKLSNGLLEARSVSDVLVVTQETLRDLFDTDFAVIKLFYNISDDPQLSICDSIKGQLFSQLMLSNKPLCGYASHDQVKYMFGSNADKVKSSALIPLKSTQDIGILALGCVDETRFNSSMGHMFLSHLSDLVSSALAVHIEPASKCRERN